jgi:hypothetical protein
MGNEKPKSSVATIASIRPIQLARRPENSESRERQTLNDELQSVASSVAATVPPQVKRVPKEKRLNERNQSEPGCECSRHGPIRGLWSPVVVKNAKRCHFETQNDTERRQFREQCHGDCT